MEFFFGAVHKYMYTYFYLDMRTVEVSGTRGPATTDEQLSSCLSSVQCRTRVHKKSHDLVSSCRTNVTCSFTISRSGGQMQGRRSLWDRGDTSPQYLDWGDMITNVPPIFLE